MLPPCAGGKEFEKRMKAPYDGVLGSPPDWFPDPVGTQFITTRDGLINCRHPVEDIKRWVNEFYKWYANGRVPVSIPSGIQQEIITLAFFKFCHSLGKTEGLKLLIGNDAAHAIKIYDKKLKPLDDSNQRMHERASLRNSQIIEKANDIRREYSHIKSKKAVANHLLKHHPKLSVRRNGQPLSVDQLTRIIPSLKK